MTERFRWSPEDVLIERGLLRRHYGPGAHPGTGTEQGVHAGGGGHPKAATVQPRTVREAVASEPGYFYHATSDENLSDIAASGQLEVHDPSYGTDQNSWPDGSGESRAYFSRNAEVVWQFAPENGRPVLVRVKEGSGFHRENTGDIYSRDPISVDRLQYLGEDGGWYPVPLLKVELRP